MVTQVRPDRRVSTIIACVAVAVTALAGINVFHAFGPIHLDNDGPLVLGAAGFTFDADSTGPWTLGYQPCVNQGTDPVILESIAPASETGESLHFLGAFARLIPADTGGAIGSVAGFPPHVMQTLQPVAGFAVTSAVQLQQQPAAGANVDLRDRRWSRQARRLDRWWLGRLDRGLPSRLNPVHRHARRPRLHLRP